MSTTFIRAAARSTRPLVGISISKPAKYLPSSAVCTHASIRVQRGAEETSQRLHSPPSFVGIWSSRSRCLLLFEYPARRAEAAQEPAGPGKLCRFQIEKDHSLQPQHFHVLFASLAPRNLDVLNLSLASCLSSLKTRLPCFPLPPVSLSSLRTQRL